MFDKIWSNASRMRPWTQLVKKEVGEEVGTEVEETFRKARLANKSEKTEEEETEEMEKVKDKKFWEQIEKSYASVHERAKFLIKL